MIATEVTSPFLTPFKLSLVLAVFVAMPVILAQLWGFMHPVCINQKSELPFRC